MARPPFSALFLGHERNNLDKQYAKHVRLLFSSAGAQIFSAELVEFLRAAGAT